MGTNCLASGHASLVARGRVVAAIEAVNGGANRNYFPSIHGLPYFTIHGSGLLQCEII